MSKKEAKPESGFSLESTLLRERLLRQVWLASKLTKKATQRNSCLSEKIKGRPGRTGATPTSTTGNWSKELCWQNLASCDRIRGHTQVCTPSPPAHSTSPKSWNKLRKRVSRLCPHARIKSRGSRVPFLQLFNKNLEFSLPVTYFIFPSIALRRIIAFRCSPPQSCIFLPSLTL